MVYSLPNEYKSTLVYYLVVIFGSVFFAAMAQISKTNLIFYSNLILSFLFLFFTLGFRNFTGIDDSSYIRIFNEVSHYGWFSRFIETTMEPGFLILNSVVALFTDNYMYMQVVSSFIPLFIFYLAFIKYRNIIDISMAVFLLCTVLYFQFLSVGLIRMSIAISIVFFAYYYIPKGRPYKYIILIFIASLFHYSALLMLPLTYFAINKEKLQKKAKKYVLLSFFVLPLLFIVIASVVVPIMGSRYQTYGSIGEATFSLSSFNTIPIIILLLFFLNKFSDESKRSFKFFLIIFTFSFIISFYSGIVSFGRTVFYTYTGFFLAAAMVNKELNFNFEKVIYSFIIILYGYVYIYWTQFTLTEHIPNLFPYQNLFFTI
ncbi:EpsG family protein [Oceanobacillus sojae]|uniref:EpsG family protein n=1 Tax=Oceanobacillus sojae TaxID=582851 RepID=UPI0021A3FA38|nr:EpsG family protein [Oceanobacillus sojae]MCT1901858.1 EpsG family protein [Oceanobacillus sojae]